MGQNTILNKNQQIILAKIIEDDFLLHTFYFTGGTALSEVYLHHRESIDLDFFSEQPYDAQNVLSRIESWSKQLQYSIETRYIEPTNIYFLKFENGEILKVDFAQYPYKQLGEPTIYNGRLKADSTLDIATNKLLTTTQRTEVKDFVDLYFLLQEYTFWDLKTAVEKKFNVKIDPFVMATDFMVVDEFEYMPKMIKPLTLIELKLYFTSLAEKLGRERVI